MEEVQNGHFFALMEIDETHWGHSFVVGEGGAASFFFKLFMALITIKIQNATMIKLMTLLIKMP